MLVVPKTAVLRDKDGAACFVIEGDSDLATRVYAARNGGRHPEKVSCDCGCGPDYFVVEVYGSLRTVTGQLRNCKVRDNRGDLSVTEVCVAVGCTSLGSFSARFTELVGETPSAYRARDHAELREVPGCIVKQRTRPRRT